MISDRFHDSTRAYQGLTGGVDDKLIRGARGARAQRPPARPHHRPRHGPVRGLRARQQARASRRRSPQTGDRFEKEDLEWHGRLREAFLDIARKNADALRRRSMRSRTRTTLEAGIWDIVTAPLPRAARQARRLSETERREADQLDGVRLPEFAAPRGRPRRGAGEHRRAARGAPAARRHPDPRPARHRQGDAGLRHRAQNLDRDRRRRRAPRRRAGRGRQPPQPLRPPPHSARDTGKGFYTVIRVDEVRDLRERMRRTRGRAGHPRRHHRRDRRLQSAGRQRAAQDAGRAAGRDDCSSSSRTGPARCCRPSSRAAIRWRCARCRTSDVRTVLAEQRPDDELDNAILLAEGRPRRGFEALAMPDQATRDRPQEVADGPRGPPAGRAPDARRQHCRGKGQPGRRLRPRHPPRLARRGGPAGGHFRRAAAACLGQRAMGEGQRPVCRRRRVQPRRPADADRASSTRSGRHAPASRSRRRAQ